MTRIGATSPSMMRRVIDATKIVESQIDPNGQRSKQDRYERIVFRNTFGSVVPPFGMMQMLTNTNQTGNQRIITTTRPFSVSGVSSVCLVNGGIEVPAVGPLSFGVAQRGTTFILKTDGGTYPPGTRLGWKANSFFATLGCLFVVLGPDSIDTNCVRAMLDSSSIIGTVTTAIPTGSTPGGVLQTVNPSISYPCVTSLNPIPVGSTALAFPRNGLWQAIRLC